ncbi:YqcI/YcgG family protein [Streptomyces sp. NPDC058612]|uniref:YqcI/YcgG family protein n=1 Tax=Streptomyces sp. NPDC058612 TaxID=3346555 RepID=UPI00365723AE
MTGSRCGHGVLDSRGDRLTGCAHADASTRTASAGFPTTLVGPPERAGQGSSISWSAPVRCRRFRCLTHRHSSPGGVIVLLSLRPFSHVIRSPCHGNPQAHLQWAQIGEAVSSSTTYSSLFRPGSHPEGLESHLAESTATAGSSDFPCVFAPMALRKDELLFGAGDVARDGWGVVAMLMDLAAESIWEDPDQVVVLWLDGIESATLDDDHAAFRQILLTLLEAGGEWPAEAPVDPADPQWNFWYKGIDFFINVSTRHHRLRRSRNLGHPFTLVVRRLPWVTPYIRARAATSSRT